MYWTFLTDSPSKIECILQHTQKIYKLWNHDSLFSVGSLIKTKQFQEEVLKFFVVLWRYMVFQFPIRSECLFEQIYPVLTNIYRRLRSNFWDHSQLFRTNGVGVIEPNRPIFWAKYCIFRPMFYIFFMIIYFCNASVQ